MQAGRQNDPIEGCVLLLHASASTFSGDSILIGCDLFIIKVSCTYVDENRIYSSISRCIRIVMKQFKRHFCLVLQVGRLFVCGLLCTGTYSLASLCRRCTLPYTFLYDTVRQKVTLY